MPVKLYAALCLILLATFGFAQNALQSPDEFLPHKLGEQFSEHYMLVDYYRHVAANSDRIKLVEFGRSTQQRPQLLAIVSSAENLRRIEDIRLNNLRNAGLAAGTPDNTNPVAFVWLGFSVHGNEASGSEASMAVLHQLVNPANRETADWLQNTVVLIEPSVNPDGYNRFAHWHRDASSKLPDPDPVSREQDEPWPGGRVNHYLFDLNRDWAWTTQIESQNRIKIYNEWLPQVVADLHEQGHDDPYYFAPAAQPYHKFLTKFQSDFQVDIGKNHARYFDKNGWLYFTKEVFDLFYPSYGDTYPCFNGAIGMTYEQGCSRSRALMMSNGDTLTLRDRVAHHTTTALSTVEISSKNAARLVQNFSDYFKKSQTEPPGQYKSFVLRASNPPHKIKALTDLLDRHQIRYGKAGKASASMAAFDYLTGTETKVIVGENDLVISAYQPKGLFAQVLMEPSADLVDSLTYDITAWSLPWAYGLEAFAMKQRLDPAAAGYDTMKKAAVPTGTPYAYLAAWNSLQSARFLADLTRQGVTSRFASEGFMLNNQTYPAGTLVITRADNRKLPEFDKIIRNSSVRFNYEVTGVETGFVDSGKDLGSDAMRLANKPKILVLSGEKTYNNEFGQVWWYFDRDLGYPATILDAGKLGGVNLGDYNMLVLPEGSYGFDDATLEKISAWISGGGHLIAIGEANRAFEDKKGFNLARFARPSDKDDAQKVADETALTYRTAHYCDRIRSSASDGIPGAVVRAKMDTSHPLAFGMKKYFFSLKTNGLRYDLMKNTWNVGYLENDYQTSGFIGWNLKKNLRNSVVCAVQNKGRGSVTYLVDNPLFRGFWEEGKLLFSNAVFLVN